MKPFVKMDIVTYIIFLIISIVIPPLFIVNLILFIIQIIPRIVIACKENKERKEREEREREAFLQKLIQQEQEMAKENKRQEILEELFRED